MRHNSARWLSVTSSFVFFWVLGTPSLAGNIATCPAMSKAPIIDGKVNEAEWADATRLTGFVTLIPDKRLFQVHTSAYIGYDDKAIYVAFICQQSPHPRDESIWRTLKLTTDGDLWRTESVEVLLVDPKEKTNCYHFIVSSSGHRYDEFNQDRKWNGQWSSAVQENKKEWSVEFRIPFATIEKINRSEPVGFNLLRNIGGDSGQIVTWSPTGNLFRDFGMLNIAPGPVIRSFESAKDNSIGRRFVCINQGEDTHKYEYQLTSIRQADNQTVQDTKKEITLDPKQTVEADETVTPLPGKYETTLVIQNASDGKVVLKQDWIADLPQELNVELRKYLFHDKVEPMVYFPVKSKEAQKGIVTFKLKQGNKLLQVKRIEAAKAPMKSDDPRYKPEMGRQIKCLFDIAKCDVGNYTIEVECRVPDESRPKKAWLHFNKPPKLAGSDSQLGTEDVVPKPWLPVEVNEKTISVWGRKYEFADAALPTSILNQGHPILADKIQFTGRCNNQPLALKTIETKIVDPKATSRTVVSTQHAPGIKIDSTSCVEFDGFIKVDVEVTLSPYSKLDRLSLEVPIKDEYATLLVANPDTNVRGQNLPWPSWSGTPNGFLPKDKDVRGPFTDYLWIGNDDLGLVWSCGSMENWSLKNKKEAIRILKQGDHRVLQVNFVDSQPPKRKFKFYFILQATPVRPPSKNEVISNVYYYYDFYYDKKPMNVSPGLLTYPARGNLNPRRGSLGMLLDGTLESYPVSPSRLIWIDFVDGFADVEVLWDRQNGTLSLEKKDHKQHLKLASLTNVKTLPKVVAIKWNDDHTFELLADDKSAKGNGVLFGTQPVDGARLAFSGGVYVRGVVTSDSPQPAISFENTPHTLLLDRLTNITGDKALVPQTHPIKAAAQPGFSGGRIYGFKEFLPDGRVWLSGGIENINWFEKWRKVDYVDHILFHEYWSEYDGFLRTDKYDAGLKKFMTYAHANDLKVILHIVSAVGDTAPEFQLYGDEIWAEPKRCGYHRTDVDPQYSYYDSRAGKWQNYLIYLVDELITRYDIDGLYFDGLAYAVKDMNRWHGAGYIDGNGSLQPTQQIIETRNYFKRIRNVGNKRKDNFRMDIHVAVPNVVTASVADSHLTGEQYMMLADLAYEGDIRKCLTLDAFRANCVGKQLGFQADYHINSYGVKFKIENAMAMSVIHGIPVRREQWTAITLTMKEFEFDIYSENWHPYFKNGDRLTVTPAEVKVSYFLGKDGRLLLFLMNSGQAAVTATVQFKSTQGLPMGHSLRDRLTGKWVKYFDGQLKMHLEPWKIQVLATE